jgi:hypothetical protein
MGQILEIKCPESRSVVIAGATATSTSTGTSTSSTTSSTSQHYWCPSGGGQDSGPSGRLIIVLYWHYRVAGTSTGTRLELPRTNTGAIATAAVCWPLYNYR